MKIPERIGSIKQNLFLVMETINIVLWYDINIIDTLGQSTQKLVKGKCENGGKYDNSFTEKYWICFN